MSPIRRLIRWAGVAIAIALLFLAAGQVGSAISPLLVLREDGIALGDYHGAATQLAALSQQVIDDANHDALTTPGGEPSSVEPEAIAPPPTASSPPQPSAAPVPTDSLSPSAIATTTPTGSVTGSVQDSQTAVGITNALVSLSPGGLSTLTSSNGAFGFPTVLAGAYTISASAPGYQPGSGSITVTAGHNANINLHLVSTAPVGSVQGVVKSTATGKGLAGAIVTLTPGALATLTDGTGYFGFPNVTPGTYTVTITAAGYQPYSQMIAVTSGHSTKVNVSLTPA